ncbi:hypothetical protein [Maridesulfovibrio sp.]|uniref:hypothetical protein n=1 Tax=Maridesulfovibrio sp. TaxID=2795000 RepID=UPI0029C9E820|nr:hypothetical protein [Maridesulfovibrio sp.]
MSDQNYQKRVSDLMCSSCALKVVIEKLWDEEKSGEAYILERIKKSIDRSAEDFDDLIYSQNKESPAKH